MAAKTLRTFCRFCHASCAMLVDVEDDKVKGALATQAIMGAWCGPMSPGSAYVLMHHWIGEIDGHAGAWGWVRGGMGGLIAAMARAALVLTERDDAALREVLADRHAEVLT